MSATRRRPRAWILVAMLAGCAASGSTSPSVSPGDAPGADRGDLGGLNESDTLGDLRNRLHRLVSDRGGLDETAASDAGVCEDLCGLATDICAVKEKVCELADAHPGDASYQELCREAQQECRASQESCVDCVQGHARPDG